MMHSLLRPLLWIAAVGLVLLVAAPLVGMGLVALGEALKAPRALTDPQVLAALRTSLATSTASTALVVVSGTVLAWGLVRAERHGGRRRRHAVRIVEAVMELPVVVPPAVVGVALLWMFGAEGPFGGLLRQWNTSVVLTVWAVVLAQIVVSAPFFLQSALSAFRAQQESWLELAQALGADGWRRFWAVALPMAWPGLVAGAAMSWARALGEFGATLIFAGNLPGRTQTMPLAIYAAMETDMARARLLALLMMATGLGLLWGLRVWSSGRLPRGRPP